eukprot:TRINITY_DN3709_c0_g1_i1.p1 TRINITY_DN3709_c0_g1~~TRINITY_DN3709_c0_g1_i1.p1  ORF type:complete len:358 (+),score=92.02 TRINITY_DN3709_c0_g1_i1:134-1207(+)
MSHLSWRERLQLLVRALPKAELHLHIEGTAEAEMVWSLAEKHGIDLGCSSLDDYRRLYSFGTLDRFLDLYYKGASTLQTSDDFKLLVEHYGERAACDNVVLAEIFLDPQAHLDRGVQPKVLMDGILEGLEKVKREHGVTLRLIMCFLRHLSEEAAFETLEHMAPWMEHFIAVGLDSSEAANPPEKFTRVFEAVRKRGLPTVAHAGEEGPPSFIRSALSNLGVCRIDHGIAVMQDDELVNELAASQVPLTVCPFSNVALGAVEKLSDHPLKIMMERGMLVTVNSDDPAYFGGYVGQNYVDTVLALNMTEKQVVQLTRNSFVAAISLSKAELEGHLLAVDHAYEEFLSMHGSAADESER